MPEPEAISIEIDEAKREQDAQEAYKKWVKALANTPRTPDCARSEAEFVQAWYWTNQLHDDYRRKAGLPV